MEQPAASRDQHRLAIPVDRKAVEAFCDRWRIVEFSFFGSVLTESFGEASDIDVLVAFEEDADWSLFDIVDMREELSGLFGRPVGPHRTQRGGAERKSDPPQVNPRGSRVVPCQMRRLSPTWRWPFAASWIERTT